MPSYRSVSHVLNVGVCGWSVPRGGADRTSIRRLPQIARARRELLILRQRIEQFGAAIRHQRGCERCIQVVDAADAQRFAVNSVRLAWTLEDSYTHDAFIAPFGIVDGTMSIRKLSRPSGRRVCMMELRVIAAAPTLTVRRM